MRRGVATILGVAVAMTVIPLIGTTRVEATAEQRTTLATLYRLASDNGAFESSAAPQWILDAGKGNITAVRDPGRFRSGSRLSVPTTGPNGSIAGTTSVADATLVSRVSAARDAKPVRRLLVVPVPFGGSTWTSEDARNAQTIINALTPWWTMMSAGQEKLVTSVTAPLDANQQFPTRECRMYGTTSALMSAAVDYVTRLGLDKSYDNLMVTFPNSAPACGFGGLGTVGGGSTWTYTAPGYVSVWAHELGHNLGFPHANLCRAAQTVTYVRNCVDSEYGNSYDVMGSASGAFPTAYFSPSFLRSAGWLPDSKMTTWNGTSTTVTLFRPDRFDLGVTAANIPATDPTVGDNGYWLQYNPLPSEYYSPRVSVPNGGVVLTMSPSENFATKRVYNDGRLGRANSTSYLCDITPSADYVWDEPRMLPGNSYTDPRNRFTVTVLSVDGTKATVRIDPVASVSVSAPATVTATADGQGARTIKVDISGLTPAVNEPVSFIVDTVEDPTRTCTADVWTPTCTLTGLARGVTYTARVVGVNGSARSNAVNAGPAVIPKVPPVFTVSVSKYPRSIIAKVTVDDGGSPMTTAPTLTITGQPPCVLNPAIETACSFDNLTPRTEYELTATGANALGSRETKLSVRTLVTKPVTPMLSGAFVGSDLVLTATADKTDATNVTHLGVQCGFAPSTFDQEPIAMDPASRSVSITVPSARGKTGWCGAWAVASDEVADGYEVSPTVNLYVSQKGKLTLARITLKVDATSTRKGKVLVTWKAKDTLGGVFVGVRVGGGRPCVRKSANSCVVRNLRSGAKLTVNVSAFGRSGTVNDKRVVRVK